MSRAKGFALAVAAGVLWMAGPLQAEPVPQGEPLRVSPDDGSSHKLPQISQLPGGGFAMTWNKALDSPRSQVMAQVFSAEGLALSSPAQVGQAQQGDVLPTIGADASGNFVVAWRDFQSDGSSVRARRFDPQGQPLGAEFRVDESGLVRAIVGVSVAPDGRFVVAWASFGDSALYARRYDASGVAQGAPSAMALVDGGVETEPAISMHTDGSFVLAFRDRYGSGEGIYIAGFDAQGQPRFARTPVAGDDAWFPIVALEGDGDFQLVWRRRNESGSHDIYLQRFSTDGTAKAPAIKASDTPVSTGAGRHGFAVDSNGAATVTWDANYRLLARSFAPSGAADGASYVVSDASTYVEADRRNIAFGPEGDFLVVWQQGGSPAGLYLRRFSPPSEPPPPLPPPPPPPPTPEPEPEVRSGEIGQARLGGPLSAWALLVLSAAAAIRRNRKR